MEEKNDLHLIYCPKQTSPEKGEFVSLSSLENIDQNYACDVCGQINQTLLFFNLPWSKFPLAYLVMHQVFKVLGLTWLIFTPLLGGSLITSSILGFNLKVNQTWFWAILALNLYWLYYFLKRERPQKTVSLDIKTGYLNIESSLSLDARASLQNTLLLSRAVKKAASLGYLFLVLLENYKVRLILNRLNQNTTEIKKKVKELLKNTPADSFRDFAPSTRAAIVLAYEEASHLHERYIEPEDLFLASLKVPGIPQVIFKEAGLTFDQTEKCASWIVETIERNSLKTFLAGFLSPTGGLNRDWTGTVTPELDKAGVDFTKLAKRGLLPEIVGRSREKEKVADILSQSTKNNCLLIGPSGAGKTSIAQGLAQDIAFSSAYPIIRYKRIVSLDVGALVAGAGNQGELEEKVQNIIRDLDYGNIILFLDDIHNLAATKIGESDVSVLSLLEKPLSFGKLQVIGATTREEYHRSIEKDSTISRLFQIIEIKEATLSDSLKISLSYVPYLERKYKVFITYPAVEAAVSLANRYIHNQVLPDKALDVLEQSTLAVSKKDSQVVTVEDVSETVSNLSKIPVSAVTEKESEKLLHLEEKLHERVIGQEEAVASVSSAMRRARAGLKPPNRPIAAFLFLGPTGVGKTELAKALAEVYFGSEKNMERLDMAEYETEESISELIGAPPGQKGYESGGQLTEAVRNQPFTLVLLDEIEKAHPNIINSFLSVLDDGRLTDSSGVVVDFTNTIIIATSNAGSSLIADRVANGVSLEQIRQELLKSLGQFFKPEFLNRFDGVIIYKPLTPEQILKITDLLLKGVALKTQEQGIEFKYGPVLVEQIAKLGFDPTLGARPLRRVIQDKVENYLANLILQSKVKKGDTISLDQLP